MLIADANQCRSLQTKTLLGVTNRGMGDPESSHTAGKSPHSCGRLLHSCRGRASCSTLLHSQLTFANPLFSSSSWRRQATRAELHTRLGWMLRPARNSAEGPVNRTTCRLLGRNIKQSTGARNGRMCKQRHSAAGTASAALTRCAILRFRFSATCHFFDSLHISL